MRWYSLLGVLTLLVLCPTQNAAAVPITIFSGIDGNAAVPEPTSVILLVTGLTAMWWRRRRLRTEPAAR